MNFPVYISYNKKIHSVYGELILEDIMDELKANKGYIYNDHVWIYRPDRLTSEYPSFNFDVDGVKFSSPSEEVLENYHVSKTKDLSLVNTVYKTDPNAILYDAPAITDMNSAKSVCVPEIKETDDFLKQIIKQVIISKQVNTQRLKSKMDKPYKYSNLMSALNGATKMSVVNFIQWCELLKIDVDITVADNGMDKTDPLKQEITFHTSTGQVIIRDV